MATTIAYVDCAAGVAGDMLLGALIDAGASIEEIKRQLSTLPGIQGEWDLHISRLHKGPGRIAGSKVTVSSVYGHRSAPAPGAVAKNEVEGHDQTHAHDHEHSHQEEGALDHGHNHSHEHDHDHELSHDHNHSHDHGHDHDHGHGHSNDGEPMRNLQVISSMIQRSELSSWAKEKSIAAFTLLAEAEAHTHGTTIDEIHFHEVGAIDSIVDTVGSIIALDILGVREVCSTPLPFSSGTVFCAHGILPVPPPATFRLMIGVPVCPAPKGAKGELVTPTGISLIKAVTTTYGEPPAFIPTHTGVGAGTKEFPNHANIVRVAIGQRIDNVIAPSLATQSVMEQVVILETNLDDVNPQVIGYVQELLLDKCHALDVWTQPIQMKKNRPGVMVSVMAKAEHEDLITQTLFRETTTLGVRRRVMERSTLDRRFVSISYKGQDVRVKVASRDGELLNVYPEFDHCKAIARNENLPLLEVINQVQRMAIKSLHSEQHDVPAHVA